MTLFITYLVGLVVVLWVVLEDLWFLLVIEISHKIVHTELLSPLLAIYEPGKRQLLTR